MKYFQFAPTVLAVAKGTLSLTLPPTLSKKWRDFDKVEDKVPNSRRLGALLLPALLALSLVVSGCKTLDVRSTTDDKADFSKFHTYNYAEPSPARHPLLSEQNRQRVQAAVNAEMEKRSLRLADQPELVFSISLETSEATYNRADPAVQSGSLGANLSKHYGLRYDKDSGAQPVVSYTEGTLLFRALDRGSNRAVWEGAALGVLYQDRPDDQVQQRIQEAVKAVFKKFPIKPGSPAS